MPLPRPTELSQPFWDGCRKGELLVQRCADCSHYVFIPQPACTSCLSTNLTWVRSSGKGTVYSFTIVYRPQQPAFEVPYVVAIVRAEEGWDIPTNIVGIEPQKITIGMPVQVTFEKRSDEISVPLFHPA